MAWSPVQIVAVVVGVDLTVIGGVALARAGMHHITGARVQAGGLHYTTMSALLQLIAGIVLLLGAISPHIARRVSAMVGLVMLVFV